MKVVILCGGMGTRLREETEYRPKPIIEIGGRPILWHIMKIYAHYGFNEFILCLGYKGWMIKEYFLNYAMMQGDFTIEVGKKNDIQFHNNQSEEGWKVTLAETGLNSMTGSRVKKIEKYIDDDTFMLTYGDGVADININELLSFHYQHGKIGTVTGVCPPSKFGELFTKDNCVIQFDEKPQSYVGLISGGFFVFSRRMFDYLDDDENCVLEKKPMENLVTDGELMVYKHNGFWQCMDTYRDFQYLEGIWEKGEVPWRVWGNELILAR
jgi:glucose-1-phosphate cytidylyltransferase